MSNQAENKDKKEEKPSDNKKKTVAEILAEDELSTEDQDLKDKLELCVERLSDT